MESIERYSSLPSGAPRNFIQGSYDQLSSTSKYLHPEEIVEPLGFHYRNDMIMDFLPGVDLFTGQQIMVPGQHLHYLGILQKLPLSIRLHFIIQTGWPPEMWKKKRFAIHYVK